MLQNIPGPLAPEGITTDFTEEKTTAMLEENGHAET